MWELNNVINQMDLADIRENSTPKLRNILASQQPRKLSSKLTRYYNTKQVSKDKKIEITTCLLSNLHGFKLGSTTVERSEKCQTHRSWATRYWIKIGLRQESICTQGKMQRQPIQTCMVPWGQFSKVNSLH